MKQTNKKRTHMLALKANKHELVLFERIKKFHRRASDSDMIRFLIEQEAEKILPRVVPADTNANITVQA
ncbi:MAG: hypothetical protein IJT68_06325 [Lentisphaeria bacterium]|nr:hypothetical protein [Lentisphaeria bacterium]